MSQSRLGYAKYSIKKEGNANKIVTRMYRAKMAALAGMAYTTIMRNMITSGNLAVMCAKKTSDLRKERWILSMFRYSDTCRGLSELLRAFSV